jgi:porin
MGLLAWSFYLSWKCSGIRVQIQFCRISGKILKKMIPDIAALFAVAALASTAFSQSPTTAPSAPPTTHNALAIPAEQQPLDASQYLLGNPANLRGEMAAHGITIEPYLIIDDSRDFLGGINTRSNNTRDRFNLPVTVDTEKLFGWHGGTFAVVYQYEHGRNAAHQLTGDAQNFSFATIGDGRSQIGQLWYQQKFLNDTMRLRLGKLEGNADFDALDNDQDFMNNSFQTSPTLGLLPSYPDTATGIQLFYEPPSGFYAGAGVFDGSGARGVHTGEYGPSHFFDRTNDVYYISEIGLRYKLPIGNRKWPGRVAFAGWYDANTFGRLDGVGNTVGTFGFYALFDQLLWKPYREQPIPAGPPGANENAKPEEENYPGGIAVSASLGWADPLANRIDGNALAALTYTGVIPGRSIDELGLGATYAHFSNGAATRDDFELAIETFYRIRFTQFVSLKPDLQYIIHPSGSGEIGQPDRNNALVGSLRLEISF